MDLFGWSFSTTETTGRAPLKRRRVPLVVGCLLLGLAAHGQAQTFTLPAAADTYLQQGNGNQNHGGDTTFLVAGNQHALLRFDQAALASAVGSGRLVSASLELFVHSTSGNWGTGGRPVEAHAATADWTEAGATWNCAVDSKPTNSKPDCAAQWAGGSFAPDPTDTLLQTNAAGSFVSFDVTADVAAFLAGPPNQGWLLQRTDDEGGGKVEYSSREAVAAERPRLVLLVETATNDQVAPSLAITAPAQPVLVNEPTPVVTLEYADGGSGFDTATLQVLVDGQDITASCAAGAQSASCRAPSLPAGNHTVEAHLRDHAGNAAQASFSFQLLLGPGPHLVTFQTVADSYLRKGEANRNSGTEPILRVREAGENRSLVQFDPQSLVTSLTGATLISAALELHIEKNFRNWGKSGGTVGAHRLTAAWTETGVTWNCPADSNPTNGKADCAAPWAGGSFAPAPTATVLHTRDLVGWVSYDVTADVAAFVAGTANRGWLLKKEDETKSGRVDYDSRQGTAGEGPRLVLLFTTAGGGDTTPPTVTITAPADGSLLASASPALAATYSDLGSGVDPASVHLLVDGIDQTAPAQVTASGLTFTPAAPLAEGTHTATVSVGDRAGNAAQAAVGFTTDSVPPALAITTPSDPIVYGTLPEIDLAFADATTGTAFKTLSVSLDGRDLTASCSVDPASATCSPGALAFGSHTLVATVRDVVGNSATATATFQLADQDPPTVAIATPNDGSLVNTPTLQVTGSASDDGAIAQITVNGAVTPLIDGGFQATVGLTEGANEIRVAATDTSGKQTLATVTVTLDTTAPVLTIDSPAPGQAVNSGTVRVSGRATDENGVDAVEVNGTPVSLALDRFTLDLPIVDGHNTVQVRGVDRAGNARTTSVDVVRFTLPAVTIGSPVDLGTLAATTVDVTGTVSEPVATVTVNGLPGAVSGSAFTVSDVPLVEGGNTLTATVTTADGRVGTSSINVVRDLTPPHIAVEAPEPGAVLYDDAITVSGLANDIVAGTVNAAQVSVTVNGRPAMVANRSFVAAGVPLVLGDNSLTVVAVDASGNSTQTRLTVRRVPAATMHVEALSGDGQQAVVGTPLPQPLAAAVLDAAGNPIPGKVVLFTLRGNNGSLDGGKRQIAVSTDASGKATAHFTLGTRAGEGNQVVEAAVTGVPGTARFTATGLPGPGALLLLDAGDQQVGVAGQALPRPLVAVVTDTGFNRLPGVAVDLRVVKGQGHFEQGLQEITLTSDDDGRVIVPFVLDPLEGIGNNVVEATISASLGARWPASQPLAGRLAIPRRRRSRASSWTIPTSRSKV
jgi:hypothetical protein